MKHHVGETPRRVILQELAHRMQKVVADVLSPWYMERLRPLYASIDNY
jgi:hypothetical protein